VLRGLHDDILDDKVTINLAHLGVRWAISCVRNDLGSTSIAGASWFFYRFSEARTFFLVAIFVPPRPENRQEAIELV